MNQLKLFFCLLLSVWVGNNHLFAQEPIPSGEDTMQKVHILNYTKTITFKTIDDTTKLTIIAGTVKLRQGNTLFYCDSCVINNNTKIFEAWGNVHINDADTADVYSNHMRYLMNKKIAYLDGNVKLTDSKAVLTTPDLEYNMETNIGIYTHGGKVINGKSVLTSKEAYYYADLKDIYFKKDVLLLDPAYKIETDSLLYNSATRNARFISYTVIKDSSGRIIRTREGFYNQETGKAQFGMRPQINDGCTIVIGNSITLDDTISIVEGNAIIRDTCQGTTIIGGRIIRNKNTEAVLASKKPLMIVKQENDSIYISADTLFTAKLSDLNGKRDSLRIDSVKGKKQTKIEAANNKDSTDRYFVAYRNVRIFNDSIQAACDSMFYSFKDSTFRLYDDPVVWASNSQVTGDTILLFTKNKKADKVEAFDNGFMINRLDDQAYNQIKSRRIDGYFLEGNIDSVRARGFAECIYYIQDDDSAYTGINESKCDIMDIYFRDKTLFKVVFRAQVTGTIWPMSQKGPDEMKLTGFRWQEARRPKTKFEMFE